MFIPFGNRIIIKKVKEENKGMLIPKSASQEEKAIGEVTAISNHMYSEYDNQIKVGDKIIYDEFAGSLIPGEDDLTILDIKYVFAIIK